MAFLKFEISSPEKNFFSSPDFESKVRANPNDSLNKEDSQSKTSVRHKRLLKDVENYS